MIFRNIYLKTLRDCRVAILAWGLGMGAFTPLVFASMSNILSRPELSAQLEALTQSPALRLFAEPVDVLTPGGYATWRLALIFPMLGVWAILAVTRMLRGEEERGALDLILATPQSRGRVIAEKLAALASALLLIGATIGALAFAGGRIYGASLDLARALLFGVNIAALAMVFGGLALVISQFTRERRIAAGTTGALLGLSVLLTAAGRTMPSGEWIARVSPVYAFELNKPLIVTSSVNVVAMVALVAIAALLGAVGAAMFVRRDVGGAVALPIAARFGADRASVPAAAATGWSIRSLFARSLRTTTTPMLWWSFALAAYSSLITALLRQMQRNVADLLQGLSTLGALYAEAIAKFTRGGDLAANASILNAVFALLVGVLAIFATTIVGRWTSDEQDGRLELLLAAPQSRTRVIVSRFAAATIAIVVVAGVVFASVVITAALVDMALDRDRLAEAALGMAPIAMLVVAVGYLLAGWLRGRAVTGVMTLWLLASFLLTYLGPLLNWPAGLLRLSIFNYYGAPLVDGLRPSTVLALLAAAAGIIAVAALRFERKDLT